MVFRLRPPPLDCVWVNFVLSVGRRLHMCKGYTPCTQWNLWTHWFTALGLIMEPLWSLRTRECHVSLPVVNRASYRHEYFTVYRHVHYRVVGASVAACVCVASVCCSVLYTMWSGHIRRMCPSHFKRCTTGRQRSVFDNHFTIHPIDNCVHPLIQVPWFWTVSELRSYISFVDPQIYG